jgi:hypothetical protein
MMNTIRIYNHGPGAIQVLDGNADLTVLSPDTGNVFATPIEILDVSDGSAVVTPAKPPPSLPPTGAEYKRPNPLWFQTILDLTPQH